MTLTAPELDSDATAGSTNRLIDNKPNRKTSFPRLDTFQYAMMPVTQPNDVITVSWLTSFSPAAASDDDDDDDDVASAAGDDTSVNNFTMLVRCDVGASSEEKSMTSSCWLMTSRSRLCRMRLTGSTSRNCTNPRRRARSAAAIFALCFVKPTPSNVCQCHTR